MHRPLPDSPEEQSDAPGLPALDGNGAIENLVLDDDVHGSS